MTPEQGYRADRSKLGEDITSRYRRSVAQLLGRRPDLVGVHPWADVINDHISWSA